MAPLVDEDDHADHDHDRDLHEDGHAYRCGRKPDAAHRQPDGADSKHEGQWSPCGVPRCVVGQVIATMPPDMVNTPAMATVYPMATSRAVATPALGPSEVSTYVMKLPAYAQPSGTEFRLCDRLADKSEATRAES